MYRPCPLEARRTCQWIDFSGRVYLASSVKALQIPQIIQIRTMPRWGYLSLRVLEEDINMLR